VTEQRLDSASDLSVVFADIEAIGDGRGHPKTANHHRKKMSRQNNSNASAVDLESVVLITNSNSKRPVSQGSLSRISIHTYFDENE